jgi:hypothetical protein
MRFKHRDVEDRHRAHAHALYPRGQRNGAGAKIAFSSHHFSSRWTTFEQVLDQEEKVSQDEFSKFEQRLNQKQQRAEQRNSE